MKYEQWELDIASKYPLLYVDFGGPMDQTCMHWGFACGEEYKDLIVSISEKLEPMIAEYIKSNPDKPVPRCAQVKTKFNWFCFYMNSATPEMHDAINGLVEDWNEITNIMADRP